VLVGGTGVRVGLSAGVPVALGVAGGSDGVAGG
jgi:hypothetical protein